MGDLKKPDLGLLAPAGWNSLRIRLRSGSPFLRCLAAIQLSEASFDSAPILCELLSDRDWTVRTRAATCLGRLGDPRAAGPIRRLRMAARKALRVEGFRTGLGVALSLVWLTLCPLYSLPLQPCFYWCVIVAAVGLMVEWLGLSGRRAPARCLAVAERSLAMLAGGSREVTPGGPGNSVEATGQSPEPSGCGDRPPRTSPQVRDTRRRCQSTEAAQQLEGIRLAVGQGQDGEDLVWDLVASTHPDVGTSAVRALGQIGTARSVDPLEDAYECLTTEVSSLRHLTAIHEGFVALRVPILLFGTSTLRQGSLIGQFSLAVYAILQLALHAGALGFWRRHASVRGPLAVDILKSITQILERESRPPGKDVVLALHQLSREAVRQRRSTRRAAQRLLELASRRQQDLDNLPRAGCPDLEFSRVRLPVVRTDLPEPPARVLRDDEAT